MKYLRPRNAFKNVLIKTGFLIKSGLSLLMLTGIFIVFSSCSNDNSAKLKVVNLSPDTRIIDVFDDGDTLFKSIAYGDSSEYISISTDNRKPHQITVTPTDSFTTLVDQSKTFANDKEYTLFLFNIGENASSVFQLDDNFDIPSGKARLRFVHGSPTSRNVDMYITFPEEPLNDVTPTMESAGFRRISTYYESVAGEYQIRVTPAGDSSTVIADSGPFHVEEGRVYTTAVVDSFGGGQPYEIIIFADK